MKHQEAYRKICISWAASFLICWYFSDETSMGTKDVADILVKRYGLERSYANREIITPVGQLKKIAAAI
ncbi:MAG: hypothetical protein U9O97_05225 [Elusimicrobiota bacterium]|nr:hypothetical protein [Elusimicrobiota bacterium]